MIVENPKNQTVYEGDTVEFVCRIVSDVVPHLQWLKHYTVKGSFVDEENNPYVKQVKVKLHI